MSGLYSELVHVIDVLAPVDTAGATIETDIVDAGEATRLQFIIQFGVITGDTVVITLEECDDITASNSTAIGFNYRESAGVGTDTMGAITAVGAGGVTAAADDDGHSFLIDVDPAMLAAGYPYVRLVADPGGSASVCLLNAICIAIPRNAQSVTPSMVD